MIKYKIDDRPFARMSTVEFMAWPLPIMVHDFARDVDAIEMIVKVNMVPGNRKDEAMQKTLVDLGEKPMIGIHTFTFIKEKEES